MNEDGQINKPQITFLGIETSCDETAAAVVRREPEGMGVILSNVVHSQVEEHAAYGGVVPEIAARAHVEILDFRIAEALEEAGVALEDLDGIAVTAGPGLIGGLLVGLTTAKALALVHRKPLIALNHLEAHALTVGLSDGMAPPYLLLLVSGGHTQTLIVRGVGQYERLGTTLDDALGEAFDKTAKLLGLGYPGGPEVERRAQGGDGKRFSLPRPMKGREELHFSFAGLKTALRQKARAIEPLDDRDIADLCASFELAVTEAVSDRVMRAMAQYKVRLGQDAPRRLVVAGGVAANKALRGALEKNADQMGFSICIPPVSLCTDNGAMIAWAGIERYLNGWIDGLDAGVHARWPLDPDASLAIGAGVKA